MMEEANKLTTEKRFKNARPRSEGKNVEYEDLLDNQTKKPEKQTLCNDSLVVFFGLQIGATSIPLGRLVLKVLN